MRTKLSYNIELKYKLFVFDFRIKQFVFLNNYASLKSIADYLNLKYNVITEIYNNRSKCYKPFLKIEDL